MWKENIAYLISQNQQEIYFLLEKEWDHRGWNEEIPAQSSCHTKQRE